MPPTLSAVFDSLRWMGIHKQQRIDAANHAGSKIPETSADWLLEREEANTPEIMNLINNYKEADQRGKETIVNVAELEARRSRSDRKQPDEPQDSTGRKIDFVDLAVKQNLSYQGKEDQEDDEELKPFA
ncbi:MAG: hypothetical protein K2P87_15835 [Lachnospiraceae bacterium]|nr:hypothetical protein [Lachnospiraceae bacterium]